MLEDNLLETAQVDRKIIFPITMNSSETPSHFPENPTWHDLDEVLLQSTEEPSVAAEVSAAIKVLRDVKTVMWYVIPPVLVVFGTFGNIMTIVVMRRMRSSQSTACLSIYFTALAVSDQCYLTTSVVFYWVHFVFSWPSSLFRHSILCFSPKFIWNVAGITSAWFLVAMTWQRVTSVVAPHRVAVVCTVKRGLLIVAFITFASCAFNIHFLFTWIFYPEYNECHFKRQYEYLIGYFEWQGMLATSVFSFVFLIIGNAILIWHVIKSIRFSRQMRQSTDQNNKDSDTGKVYSMSVTLIITSTAFLIFTLPDNIFDVYLEDSYIKISDEEFGATIDLVRAFCVMFLMAAVATNFYLYLLTGNKFREEVRKYLFCQGKDHGVENTTTSSLYLPETSASESGKAARHTANRVQR